MILVKRKHLYILVLLFSLIIIFGEIKFFYAVHSLNLQGNTDLKYEVENFIFAFLIIIILVYLFLVNFIRKSTDLLKRMDKLIELSEFGKYNVSAHLNKLGNFGEKVNYLLLHLSLLNDLKSMRISASSEIINILVEQIGNKTYIFDRIGNSISYSVPAKSREEPKKFNDIFTDLNHEDIYEKLDKSRKVIKLENISVLTDGGKKENNVEFHPVINTKGDICNIVVFIT